ncbi:putative cytochrome P450 [Periconia macrospinosa]|uniref:Putative cytochrome P450 n=1 Tax=Periconia macrospinosa TaxID=97972 RepID=A0A2V1DL54_9PLEO|nr:putative cytochrome P450 [Periconia macrospinosa]
MLSIIVAAISILIAYVHATLIYNLWFHPLAKFPGPWLARSTLLWRMFFSMRGRFHRVIEQQHQKYGPVFRVSPNELSFGSVGSWKAIYAPPPSAPPLTKTEFYTMYGSGFKSLCIASERDPSNHNRMKRSLAGGFSSKALFEQEEIVQQCVDQFVQKIGEAAKGSEPVDMKSWYEMVAFDVLGEMAFGESFHCVDSGKPHFWQQMTTEHLFFITLLDNMRRYPLLRQIGSTLLPSLTTSIRDKHSGYSRSQVSKRLAHKGARKDILANVVAKVETGEVPQEELTAHASTLILAGGETVGTFMTAATYWLCKTPSTQQKLRKEIRDRYERYEDIDAASAMKLPYVQAVINEALRIYPPASQGFPRTSPGAMIDGYYVPKGTEVYTSAWTVTHDPKNFERPNEFIPERWIDPENKDIKEASQPFSLGPRVCIGRNFAYMEMSSLLAKVFYRYDMELVDPNMDFEGQSHMHVMWWKPSLPIRLTERMD